VPPERLIIAFRLVVFVVVPPSLAGAAPVAAAALVLLTSTELRDNGAGLVVADVEYGLAGTEPAGAGSETGRAAACAGLAGRIGG
jgi:hypothetical protein